MPDSLMVIFSMGGVMLARQLRPRSLRCRTAFLPVAGVPPRVTISPWPGTEEGTRGVVADGQVTMLAADGSEVASRPLSVVTVGGATRSDDLQLLSYTATTLWTWVGLPVALSSPEVQTVDRGGGIVDVTVPEGWPVNVRRHRLHLDGEGRVVRHEEGRFVHHLSGHCVFGTTDSGDVVIATKRRTTVGDRVTVLWADVVAAAVHPGVA